MAARRLGPDEEALWARVRATVRPMPGRKLAAPAPERLPLPAPVSAAPMPFTPTPPPSHARREPGETLDGGWDRRLAGGVVAPDRMIDLHGHTLASAHAALEMGLAQAVARQDRVILLVTGKPPRPESQRPHGRGAIRASIADWLRLSIHAGAIAAVRNAHPRHGGAGALYIVLRRRR
ncbi:Smr/MutS family protein [uncultured Sphingomonas sp.]|uniref:Smr/MutS family protein n=1 Tax=uncultured Sphingomonas sp. TaxID=158754 RepID=UPI0025EBD602|nr:Smr/MutS family protein [uncultured Sphingomonas sp.]